MQLKKRVVVYIEPSEYDKLMEALRLEGMTLSGWFRKKVRLFLEDK